MKFFLQLMQEEHSHTQTHTFFRREDELSNSTNFAKKVRKHTKTIKNLRNEKSERRKNQEVKIKNNKINKNVNCIRIVSEKTQ